MDAPILILKSVRRRSPIELYLSTLGGLRVIPTKERDFGNVFQSTIPRRWESPGDIPYITGEG